MTLCSEPRVSLCIKIGNCKVRTNTEVGKVDLTVFQLCIRVVCTLDVRAKETGKRDGLTGRGELSLFVLTRCSRDANLHALPTRVFHLRCNGALPDQVIKTRFVRGRANFALDVFGLAELIT